MGNLMLDKIPVGKGEIVIYQPDDVTKLEVIVERETVWLTQEQIAALFGVKRPAITKHIRNIITSQELDEYSVCSILERTAVDGKKYMTQFYNLDMILSVGYRVNSKNAISFRRWANAVLKEYLLRGYALNNRFAAIEGQLREHQSILDKHDKQIDFFIRSSLPPIEGIFYNGQIFDAYVFISELVKSAKSRIILIDNYADESVLLMLSKRREGVSAQIRTCKLPEILQQDIQKHNSQYSPIEIIQTQNIHDRFLIVDDDIYHIGASLKDLGKKLFAFSKMNLDIGKLL